MEETKNTTQQKNIQIPDHVYEKFRKDWCTARLELSKIISERRYDKDTEFQISYNKRTDGIEISDGHIADDGDVFIHQPPLFSTVEIGEVPDIQEEFDNKKILETLNACEIEESMLDTMIDILEFKNQ